MDTFPSWLNVVADSGRQPSDNTPSLRENIMYKGFEVDLNAMYSIRHLGVTHLMKTVQLIDQSLYGRKTDL